MVATHVYFLGGGQTDPQSGAQLYRKLNLRDEKIQAIFFCIILLGPTSIRYVFPGSQMIEKSRRLEADRKIPNIDLDIGRERRASSNLQEAAASNTSGNLS
jgi:hypothetical protein